ncbi:MAG TPA: hypothetical protein VIY73_17570, partial [Polyangiaceae bacterium]
MAGSTTKVHGATLVGSLVFHAVLGGGLFWAALHSLGSDPVEPTAFPAASVGGSGPVTVELPSVGDGITLEDRSVDPTGEPPTPRGGTTVAHLDTGTRGRGGDVSTSAPALNLADENDRMRLSPDLLNRLDRDQIQRLRVARVRQSWEDRRSTTHPTELTLVVTGPARRLERRPSSPADPSRGALESPSASIAGGELGAGDPGDVDAQQNAGGARLGSMRGAPGSGVADGA